jgi:16S rRNA (adenine1518-N6/adenine1519-N6)-dimethyltransferase
VRAVARRVGILPSRRLGQHFLVDRGVLESLVAALAPAQEEVVIEIGCGIGTLTGELAAHAHRVIALDLDPACVEATRLTQRGRDNVEVVEADARSLVPRSLGVEGAWAAAGNLPYRLTGAILSRVFERDDPPRVAAFLVQREVAARLAAGSGSWSLATVAIRSLAGVERVRDVPPGAFEPPPAVHSSVIRMHPRRDLDLVSRAAVLRLARLVFQQRRKTLRHGLAHALGGDAVAAAGLLQRVSIDATRRPGTLALDEWDRLARAVAELRGGLR